MTTQNDHSKAARAAGWIISGLLILFFLWDASMKFSKPEIVVKTTTGLGYPQSVITPLGMILLICTVLYAVPRTAFIGAILLTGYLGGAVATHLRVSAPLFSNTLFPVYFGILVWLGLYLRSSRLRAFLTHKNQNVQ